MEINANTKINALIKHDPRALEAIVSISSQFEKLRNPFLRKLIAGRTSIATASKAGGCSVNDFFNRLRDLDFIINTGESDDNRMKSDYVPAFMQKVDGLKIVTLDVRPQLEKGEDPLREILACIAMLGSNEVLKVVNSFEPTPLRLLLGKQGFESHAQQPGDGIVETYFYKSVTKELIMPEAAGEDGWDVIKEKYKNDLVTIDVRHLQMPLPLVTITEALEKLPAGKALFVVHKKVPVFLFAELAERNFFYLIKRVSAEKVYLLIFK